MPDKILIKHLFLVLFIEVSFEILFINILKILNIPSNLYTLTLDKVIFFILLLFLNNKLTKQNVHFSVKVDNNGKKYIFMIFVVLLLIGLTHINTFFEATIIGLIACTTEEYLMRGVVLISFLQIFKNSKNIYIRILFPIFLSSILFGTEHFINLYSQNLSMTLAQVIATTASGFVLASIFLRTGNLLYPMIGHFSLDFFIVSLNGMSQNTNVSISSVILPSLFYLFISFIILIPILGKHNHYSSFFF